MATELSRRAFLTGAALAATAAIGAPDRAEAQQQAHRIIFNDHDIRGRDEVGIVSAATSSSVNSVALLVRTAHEQAWSPAITAAYELAQEGYPVSVLLAADGEDRLDFYAGGVEIRRMRNLSVENPDQLKRDVRDSMIHSYNIAFGPLLVSELTPALGQ